MPFIPFFVHLFLKQVDPALLLQATAVSRLKAIIDLASESSILSAFVKDSCTGGGTIVSSVGYKWKMSASFIFDCSYAISYPSLHSNVKAICFESEICLVCNMY